MQTTGSGFHPVDYVIFVGFLAISNGIGIFYACRGDRQRTNEEFLMGKRKLKTLPVAISMVASLISGALILGGPAEIYLYGCEFMLRTLGFAISLIISAVLFVPVFFRLQVTSSFEYLEARYRSSGIKLLGSITMLIQLFLYIGIVLYGPAVAVEAINGIPIWVTILITSAVTVCYTTLGGMKAVVYTDVFQACCMLLGAIAIVVLGTLKVGSSRKVLELNTLGGRMKFLNFNPDPTIRTTFWSAMFNTIIGGMRSYGVGQTGVQRICALPTMNRAKCSMVLAASLMMVLMTTIFIIGPVMYAYYEDIGCDPIRSQQISSPNQLVPYFIRNVLNYPGMLGMFLAMLFGAALSSVSTYLNSAATILWQDILRCFFKHYPETRRTMVCKILVVMIGAFGIGIAFLAKFVGSHVLQGMILIDGIFCGQFLAVFLIGVLFPFANSKGALIGWIAATVLNVWIAVGGLLYKPVSNPLPTTVANCNFTWIGHRFYDNSTSALKIFYLNYSMSNDFWLNSQNDSLKAFEDYEYGFFDESNTNITGLNNESHGTARPLMIMYSISYQLYPVIGLVNAIIIGIIMSLVTGRRDDPKVDRRLMVPVFYRLCRCLPQSARQFFRCDAEADRAEDNNQEEKETMNYIDLANNI